MTTRLSSAGWTAAGQAFSSLSNLLASVGAARAGGAELLGQFTVGFTVYLLLLGFQRSLVSEPLMSLPAGTDLGPDRAALTCSSVFALAAAVPLGAVGLLLDRPAVVAVAVVLPALLVQDLLRFQAFRRLASRRAALLDLAWVAVLVAALPLTSRAEQVQGPVLVWGAGALVGAAGGLVATRLLPASLRDAAAWWRRDARRYGGLLALDSVVYALSAQAVVLGLAGVLGTADLGRLRAAQLLVGLPATALVAFNVFVLPRLTGRERVRRRDAATLTAVASGISLVAVTACVVAAPLLSRLLFGGELQVLSSLVLPLGLVVVLQASTTGLLLHLKALRRVEQLVVARLVAAVLSPPVVLTAAARGGLEAAAVAMAVVAAVAAGLEALAWHRLTSAPPPASTPTGAPRRS